MTPKKQPTEPTEESEDRRAPDADGALEVAFVEGVLPPEDRRAATALEPEPVVEAVAAEVPLGPNDDLHVVRVRPDGVKTTAHGSILE